jgi:hypothetical protein
MKRFLLWLLLVSVLLFFGWPVIKGWTFSKRSLPHPNPTSYVFNAPLAQVRHAIWKLYGYCRHPDEPEPCMVIGTPPDRNPYSIDQLGFIKSDVYHWMGKPLEYKADFALDVIQVSESKTAVTVMTSHSAVRMGPSYLVHGGDYYEYVAPTTIEEYRFLLAIGSALGESNMPPLQIPR